MEVESETTTKIDASKPLHVLYCGICSMPPEFCEFGTCPERCLQWLIENHPEAVGDETAVTAAMGKLSTSDAAGTTVEGTGGGAGEEGAEEVEKKKRPKGAGAAAPKKATLMETRIVITRVQRQKRKFVTVIAGMESVPDLKIKDAAKVFGRKFSSGASVNEAANGAKEVVIQGDMTLQIPDVLMTEFKIAPTAIYFLEDGAIRPFA